MTGPRAERIAAVDVLRGGALLGILVMNIQAMAMPHAAYFNPTVYGSTEGLEGMAWAVARLLCDLKFLTLFSTLFGASLVLADGKGDPKRRLAWLLAFGLVHGHLLFYGDILFTYGAVGLLVLPALRWTVPAQAWTGLGLLLASSLLPVLTWAWYDALPGWLLADLDEHYLGTTVAREVEAFRGGLLAQQPVRSALALSNHVTGTLLEAGWRAAGCMLVGMAAARGGVFSGAVSAWPWAPLGLGAGLALTGAGLWLHVASGFEVRTWLLAQGLHELGSLGLVAGLGLAVIHLALRAPDALAVRAVGRLGRVAFSAYLLQSLWGSLVFGGHGLGQYGLWSRQALLLAPLAFWALQLALAWWWTARFRVGPLEALWRGLWRGDFSLGPVAGAP